MSTTLANLTQEQPTATPSGPDVVVLLHGIASTRWFLWPMARRLKAAGFQPRLYTYFSIRGSAKQHGQRLASFLKHLEEVLPSEARIHIVAHSMGSIVTRCAIDCGLPASVGRIVMLAPPNRGSHVARILSPWLGWISPTLAELSDDPQSTVNSLPLSIHPHEVGIVAAEYDKVVRSASTYLEDHCDYITLPRLHTPLVWAGDCATVVGKFLRTGRFDA